MHIRSTTRVRFADADVTGVAHHSFITHACDDNRLALIAAHPIPPLPVLDCSLVFRQPLRAGQTVEVTGHYWLDDRAVVHADYRVSDVGVANVEGAEIATATYRLSARRHVDVVRVALG